MKIILIVDDIDINLTLLELMAQRYAAASGEEYVILKALSGCEGLARWQDAEASMYKIGLVVSDFHMPVMDGCQFQRALSNRGYDGGFCFLTGDCTLQGLTTPVFLKPLTKSIVRDICDLYREPGE